MAAATQFQSAKAETARQAARQEVTPWARSWALVASREDACCSVCLLAAGYAAASRTSRCGCGCGESAGRGCWKSCVGLCLADARGCLVCPGAGLDSGHDSGLGVDVGCPGAGYTSLQTRRKEEAAALVSRAQSEAEGGR